ncbi:MAG TPA: cyclodeaminase/cyclohydrolase family protein [Thermoanaerobaculia bacterium]|nr:cyclodeaminase/cyclohydrolase family protein [Thermoanaerobaculia bacterium]
MTDFARLPLDEFLAALASEEPAPGGGTAAAVSGAMGAALVEMVAALTLGKEKFADAHAAVRPIAEAASTARREMLDLAREDSQAFEAVVAARRLPKETDEEKAARSKAVALSNRVATEVPMRTARAAARLLAALPDLVAKGNPSAASDAGTAALLLEASTEGALLNVGINLSGVKDPAFVAEMQRETADLQGQAQRLRSHVIAAVRDRF